MPPAIAARFTMGEAAAIGVVVAEIAKHGRYELPIGAVAARAGVCATVVRNALRQARTLGLLHVEERRIARDRKHGSAPTPLPLGPEEAGPQHERASQDLSPSWRCPAPSLRFCSRSRKSIFSESATWGSAIIPWARLQQREGDQLDQDDGLHSSRTPALTPWDGSAGVVETLWIATVAVAMSP